MTRDKILKELAPCGLDCSRCASFKDGKISKQSKQLLEMLDGYSRMATKMSTFFEPFKEYESFENILAFFAEAKCGGCRGNSKAGMPGCAAKSCVTENNIDFCGECSNFPCDKNNYNKNLRGRWIQNGEMIKKDGLQAYYETQKAKKRYLY
ncbi:MAG: DUF3795 domain-containing protein [Spirochaetales bacterium]|nr:DUF3795 domain-containing protein [Spirochaetales bacterium]